ncbi:MAG: hypothetical protein UJ210_07325 [Massilimicrobiota sp.]|jgi:hypothetical protein|nr:hypothetical protein [Massilimicrobiota sp.]
MIQMLTKEDIQKSLEDMGCSSKQVQEFVDDFENHRFECLCLFLKKKRYEILDEVHQKQKKIDHLDYLIYTLKNIQNKA